MKVEKSLLDNVANNSKYTKFSNALTIKYSGEIFKRHLKEGSVLELGPAEGLMTEQLFNLSDDITVIDGSSVFCKILTKKFPNVKVIQAMFEDFVPKKKYKNIVLGHVLEHVDDPVSVLKLTKNWLADDGIVLAAVPNAKSLHRTAAVKMGLISSEYEMSEMDIHNGHQRIYDLESFTEDFKEAGFNNTITGGYWLKPLPMSMIDGHWSEQMLIAFMELGEDYPKIAAEIYMIASV